MAYIPMVNLQQQYLRLKREIDLCIEECLMTGKYIGGTNVSAFEKSLAQFLGIKHVIGCANGTDALQIALMALELPKGSKIIVPAFTYIAPVEVLKLLGYEIIFSDVDPDTFNISLNEIQKVYTTDVKAIIVVHLFGQPCEMKEIEDFVKEKNLFLIEDNAQSITSQKNITRTSIITTSFFPSKNLGGYGDGGAVLTNDDRLAEKIRKIGNHGQSAKYFHDLTGVNSRLDAIQAAVLNVKLKYLDEFILKRKQAALFYDEQLKNIVQIQIPKRVNSEEHTFHQYTLKVIPELRDPFIDFLTKKEIATAVYYPLPCYRQKAYLQENLFLPTTELLCSSVISLPICPEISNSQLLYICNSIKEFFNTNE